MKLAIRFVVTLVLLSPAHAATIVVESTDDENLDSRPNGRCTLREAVLAANENRRIGGCPAGDPGLDIIRVPGGNYLLTIPDEGLEEDAGVTGDLDILDDVEIVGDGADRTWIDVGGPTGIGGRAIEIRGATVVLRRLTLTGGFVDEANSASPQGGCLYSTFSDVRLEDVMLTRCVAEFPGGGAYASRGRLVVERSLVLENEAASIGGGLAAVNADLTIRNSTIAKNVADTSGGGAWVQCNGCSVAPVLTIENATFAANEAAFGASYFGGLGVVGTVRGSIAESECVGSKIESLGGNVEFPVNSCRFDEATDQPWVADPGLVPGTNAGGFTLSWGLVPGSPAIDVLPAIACPETDQRGYLRTDGACDAGAFELDAVPCTDRDDDGFALEGGLCGEPDCDDERATVNPAAAEIPFNGIDDDCDPTTPPGCALER